MTCQACKLVYCACRHRAKTVSRDAGIFDRMPCFNGVPMAGSSNLPIAFLLCREAVEKKVARVVRNRVVSASIGRSAPHSLAHACRNL